MERKGFSMSIEKLLSRLDKVKSTGRDRWLCSCPAHLDKSPSMHIKLQDDGRLLINCKAGCGTYDILQSIGLDWSDIMPERALGYHIAPVKKIIYASEALDLIRYEALIVMSMGYKIASNKPVNDDDVKRVEKSLNVINKCLELTK